MKCLIWIMIFTLSFNSCSLVKQNTRFINSSKQTVDMGKFKGLRLIEIATLNYPEKTVQTQNSHVFTEIDKDNFSDSLIQSLKKSDVRVLPSAQTKIHIDFTQLVMSDTATGEIMIMSANVAVSRNGIVTRKTIQINSMPSITNGATKNNGVVRFLQALGELLREQSSFKR